MLVSYDPAWNDQNASWWAKINRAREHMVSAHRLVEQFRASQPYSLLPEPTDKPSRVAYRLRIIRPVPVAVSTTVGDALHNMRAALESLAFELARRSHATPLTAAQERASTFPICPSPASFDAFFKGAKASLYDDRARAAFREVQPFVNLEQAPPRRRAQAPPWRPDRSGGRCHLPGGAPAVHRKHRHRLRQAAWKLKHVGSAHSTWGTMLAVGAQDGLLVSLRGCLASLLSAEAGPYTHP